MHISCNYQLLIDIYANADRQVNATFAKNSNGKKKLKIAIIEFCSGAICMRTKVCTRSLLSFFFEIFMLKNCNNNNKKKTLIITYERSPAIVIM